MGISALGPSALHVLLAVAGVLCAAQIGTAAASRPSESDLDDPIHSDRYWIPPLGSNGIKCGGTSIKTGDGGEYRCFTHGEGICRDNDLGSFGPGQWTLGIVERNLTLYTPNNQISWQFCSDVTHRELLSLCLVFDMVFVFEPTLLIDIMHVYLLSS